MNAKELSEKLRVYRAKKNLTQQKLAQMAGVTEGTIIGIERCQKTPRVLTLVKIANALNIDAEELIGKGE